MTSYDENLVWRKTNSDYSSYTSSQVRAMKSNNNNLFFILNNYEPDHQMDDPPDIDDTEAKEEYFNQKYRLIKASKNGNQVKSVNITKPSGLSGGDYIHFTDVMDMWVDNSEVYVLMGGYIEVNDVENEYDIDKIVAGNYFLFRYDTNLNLKRVVFNTAFTYTNSEGESVDDDDTENAGNLLKYECLTFSSNSRIYLKGNDLYVVSILTLLADEDVDFGDSEFVVFIKTEILNKNLNRKSVDYIFIVPDSDTCPSYASLDEETDKLIYSNEGGEDNIYYYSTTFSLIGEGADKKTDIFYNTNPLSNIYVDNSGNIYASINMIGFKNDIDDIDDIVYISDIIKFRPSGVTNRINLSNVFANDFDEAYIYILFQMHQSSIHVLNDNVYAVTSNYNEINPPYPFLLKFSKSNLELIWEKNFDTYNYFNYEQFMFYNFIQLISDQDDNLLMGFENKIDAPDDYEFDYTGKAVILKINPSDGSIIKEFDDTIFDTSLTTGNVFLNLGTSGELYVSMANNLVYRSNNRGFIVMKYGDETAEQLLRQLYANINCNMLNYRAIRVAQNTDKTTKTYFHKFCGGSKIYNIDGLLMINYVATQFAVTPDVVIFNGVTHTLDNNDRNYIKFMRRSFYILQAYQAVQQSAQAIQHGRNFGIRLTLFNDNDDIVTGVFGKFDIQRIYGQAVSNVLV